MAYDWVTGARRDPDGRLLAFNLTDNQVRDPDTFNECALWIDTALHRLPPVRFERPGGVHQPWRVRDAEGRVDVTFEPTVRNEQHIGPRSALADYYGPFGWCSGTIVDNDGAPVSVDACFGMGEQSSSASRSVDRPSSVSRSPRRAGPLSGIAQRTISATSAK
ncbi:MAG: DUF2804 family protein [Actinobacteria bacterium]|nr:DUF2804 family protein [Actinomycetota bacterium]